MAPTSERELVERALSAEYLDAPDKLAELPICGLRSVCRVAGVDWAAALPTGA